MTILQTSQTFRRFRYHIAFTDVRTYTYTPIYTDMRHALLFEDTGSSHAWMLDAFILKLIFVCRKQNELCARVMHMYA